MVQWSCGQFTRCYRTLEWQVFVEWNICNCHKEVRHWGKKRRSPTYFRKCSCVLYHELFGNLGCRYFNAVSFHKRMYINISSVVEFQRWWVLKSKLFGQESTCHQGKIFKKILWVMTVCQKVPKLYFQSQFWMSKINQIFSKKKLSKNINLGDHYLLIFFF